MSPRPPGVSAVPVAASVIKAYCLSALGNAMIGSEVRAFWSAEKAAIASFGSGPPLYPESLRGSLNRGAAMMAKFLMCVRKKLHRPTNEWIVLTSVGGLASFMAFNLFFPGLIPSGVSVKPRYETSLLPKKHLSRLIFRLCECNHCRTCSRTLTWSSCVFVCTSRSSM